MTARVDHARPPGRSSSTPDNRRGGRRRRRCAAAGAGAPDERRLQAREHQGDDGPKRSKQSPCSPERRVKQCRIGEPPTAMRVNPWFGKARSTSRCYRRFRLKSLQASTIYRGSERALRPRKRRYNGQLARPAHDRRVGGVNAATVGVPRAARDAGLRSYMLSVYNYMASGVLLTGIIALGFREQQPDQPDRQSGDGPGDAAVLGSAVRAAGDRPGAELRHQPDVGRDRCRGCSGSMRRWSACNSRACSWSTPAFRSRRPSSRSRPLSWASASTATRPSATCRACARSWSWAWSAS